MTERSNSEYLARIHSRRDGRPAAKPRHWLADYNDGEKRRYCQSSEEQRRLFRAAALSKKLDEFGIIRGEKDGL